MSILTDKLRRHSDVRTSRPQFVDNRLVNYAMNHPEPGESCKTCRYFCLAVPLEENEMLPIRDRIDLDDEALLDVRGALIHGGFCLRPLVGIPPAVLINVWSNQGCGNYEGIPSSEQFVDDGIPATMYL